jgi:hypothetical protein
MRLNAPFRALDMAMHHWPARRAAIVNLPLSHKRAFAGVLSAPDRNGLFTGILLALHESRQRQAEREIERYGHLVQYARTHPLMFERTKEADRASPCVTRRR